MFRYEILSCRHAVFVFGKWGVTCVHVHASVNKVVREVHLIRIKQC